jgi:hypothetical protein
MHKRKTTCLPDLCQENPDPFKIISLSEGHYCNTIAAFRNVTEPVGNYIGKILTDPVDFTPENTLTSSVNYTN